MASETSHRKISGWILDVYALPEGMCVWIIDADGRASCLLDRWSPAFFLKAPSADLPFVRQVLESFKVPVDLTTVEKRDFFSGDWFPVLQVRLANPLLLQRAAGRFADRSGIALFNADINLGQAYFYERDLFPLAKCVFEATEEGRILSIHREDDPWAIDYEMPPLRYAHLALETQWEDQNSHENPRHSGRRLSKRSFVLTHGSSPGKGQGFVFDSTENDLIESLNRHISEWDPDILLTNWGDGILMPRLQIHSQRTGIPLKLSRDPRKEMKSSKDRNYFSYGKIIYQSGSRTLFGRLHIDLQNSFTVGHTGLGGLFEVARIAKIPIQRAARCTIGTSLSSMQHEWAWQNNYLIPQDKGQTEDFRPAEDLIASDRGGLVYEPEIGWHEDLVEFDFSSMYPEIMIRHNVTPEAINCPCCPDNRVPELNHHICGRKKGMVPAVLSPIVEKRRRYKELIKEGHPKAAEFKSRYDAFKWTLVTCFGYLGFRNARFGRIEAHECVNAFSRNALLRAKEIAEARGFHFVHAIVDSLWLKKSGSTDEEVEALRLEIEKETGLPLGFEGRYRWIRFLPSKLNPLVGVPNRYVGAFKSGGVKVRGLELRRHDTPPFIAELQEKLIKAMAEAKELNDFPAMSPLLEGIVESYRDRLKAGQFSPEDLAVRVNLTRRPSEYVHDTLSALAAKMLEGAGVVLEPGESIQYVVSAEHDKVKEWRVTPVALIDGPFEYDLNYYGRLISRAVEFAPLPPRPVIRPTKKSRSANDRQLAFLWMNDLEYSP